MEDDKTFRHIGANDDMTNHGLAAGRHMQARFPTTSSADLPLGPPSYCVDQLGELFALGLDRPVLLTGSRDGDRAQIAASVQRLSSDVLPKLPERCGQLAL